MLKIITGNEKETAAVGARLGCACRGGEVFAVKGSLGAGKTKFIQGLAKGLGVKGRVNSPTFNILKIYHLPARGQLKNFCHLDAYRLGGVKALANLGLEEYFNRPDLVVAMEWPEKIKKILPRGTKFIKIKSLGRSEREIEIK